MKHMTAVVLLGASCCLLPAQSAHKSSSAQVQPKLTPQRGQTAAQQQKDLQDCYEIAKAKTGVDPQAITAFMGHKQQPGAAAGTSSGSLAGAAGAAMGGAQNAAGEAVSQTGQAAGAAADQSAAAAGAAASTNAKTKFDLWSSADKACLVGRGYLVKMPSSSAMQAATPQPPQ
jgi:hypothetical protein